MFALLTYLLTYLITCLINYLRRACLICNSNGLFIVKYRRLLLPRVRQFPSASPRRDARWNCNINMWQQKFCYQRQMLYLYLCLPLGVQAKQLVMAAFQGQLRRSLGARLVFRDQDYHPAVRVSPGPDELLNSHICRNWRSLKVAKKLSHWAVPATQSDNIGPDELVNCHVGGNWWSLKSRH